MSSVPSDPVDVTIEQVVDIFELGRKCAGIDAERKATDAWWEGFAEGLTVGVRPCLRWYHRGARTRVTTRPRTNGALR